MEENKDLPGQDGEKPEEPNNENIENTDGGAFADDNLEQHNPDESVVQVAGMYKEWFLDYASYVILERAVPSLEDGFKPVQRRILHAMKEMDDGRYHKVANIIGQTMKYHPHGDASIGDALVQLGQKELLIDMQGNWGNIFTGDRAAAPRYIEARLSKFALEVVYNSKITEWQSSYDGRAKEPVHFPVKFPLLLAQGVEGIAVGLSTKIMPHNFNELIDASIKILQGKKVKIYPDFATAGIADFSNYNDGLRGGKVRVRAKINILDKKTLQITEIPFGTNTSSLIDSILKANDKGKIKIKKIEDNTAEHVEILVHLPPNISPDKTIHALYAFSDCEVTISPLACVIEDEKPRFIGVSQILKESTDHTLELLKAELEVKLGEFQEQWHFASLERIFIEKRIYRDIEECETWEEVISTIRKGLTPHIGHLLRDVTDDDIVRLTEIKIKRITKFDLSKAEDNLLRLEDEIAIIKDYLANLTTYAVDYFKGLKKKYGTGRERKTEIREFENINARVVAIANQKLYVNREEGFIGTGLKKDEYLCDCSDIDNIIVIREDGVMMVTKVSQKTFVGKGIIHAAVFKKKDKRTIYNLIYRDGDKGYTYIKRFAVTSVTLDKEYPLTAGNPKSKILYMTVNKNGEAEVVTVKLRPLQRVRKLKFDTDFAEINIKGRGSKGNILSRYPVKSIELREKGLSTLAARKVWFDDAVLRLNFEGRGDLLGSFGAEDKILSIMPNGEYKLSGFDLNTVFDDDLLLVEKLDPEKPVSAVYWDPEKERYFAKRFLVEDSDKKVLFIKEHEDARLELVSTHVNPIIEVVYSKQRGKDPRENDYIDFEDFIAVKGLKAQGNQVSPHPIKELNLIEPSFEEMRKPEEPKSESTGSDDESSDGEGLQAQIQFD